ncbi:hypothetical protein [Myceligenerans crystallogenes]|uniref:Lipoprotein n=1 Tax=Myceligenerans crystallogenes TaxID=316335 RepID=A0ABN2N860_9MICO
MRRTVAVFALVTTLALTGCSMTSAGPGGAGDGSDAASSAPAGPLSKEEAAAQFSQIVAPYNGVLEQFEEAVNSDAPVEEQAGLAAATGAALRAEAEGLRNIAWPEDVAEDAQALAAANDEAAAHWEHAAGETKTKDILKAVDLAMEVDAGDAAANIRKALDLPEYKEK